MRKHILILIPKRGKSYKAKFEENSFNLLKKIREQSLRILISLLFSLGLVGGAKYILFEFKSELEKIDTEVLEMEIKQRDLTFFCSMLSNKSSCFFSNQKNQKKLLELIEFVIKNKKSLSSKKSIVLTDAKEWCVNALHHLNIEKGIIQGFYFGDNLWEKYQNKILEEYEQLYCLVQMLLENISNVRNLTPLNRNLKLITIKTKLESLLSITFSVRSMRNQVISRLRFEIIEINLEIQHANNLFKECKQKLAFSFLGILAAIFVILWNRNFKKKESN